MKVRLITVLLLCFGLICCASAPAPKQIVSSFSIDKPYDATWSALIEVFAELQLPIQNMEKDSGLILTDWIDFTGQDNTGYCDCGGLGINIEVNRLGKFNVFVKKTGDNSCDIKVNTQYQQTYKFGDDLYKRNCVSTGKLEAEIYNRIKEKVV